MMNNSGHAWKPEGMRATLQRMISFHTQLQTCCGFSLRLRRFVLPLYTTLALTPISPLSFSVFRTLKIVLFSELPQSKPRSTNIFPNPRPESDRNKRDDRKMRIGKGLMQAATEIQPKYELENLRRSQKNEVNSRGGI